MNDDDDVMQAKARRQIFTNTHSNLQVFAPKANEKFIYVRTIYGMFTVTYAINSTIVNCDDSFANQQQWKFLNLGGFGKTEKKLQNMFC